MTRRLLIFRAPTNGAAAIVLTISTVASNYSNQSVHIRLLRIQSTYHRYLLQLSSRHIEWSSVGLDVRAHVTSDHVTTTLKGGDQRSKIIDHEPTAA